MRPLAIIEPDLLYSATLRATLEAAGFHAECFTTATNALAALRTRSFALAILGLDLHDTDPYAVCREVSPHLPIITVARECTSDSCVRSLECGADDCVVRTTAGRELVARVHNVLRRAPHRDDYESLETSLAEMRVRTGNTTHDLTRGETEVLKILVHYAPAPVTVPRICELLPEVKRGTVESRIKSLRRKLGPLRMVSRGSLGYQLVDGPQPEPSQPVDP